MTSRPDERADPGASVGAYVHVPFCAKRCDYCAFATWTDRGHLQDRYVAGLVAEVRKAVSDGLGPVTSVFFGGGTPSLVEPSSLMSVLDAIPLHPDAEVTVEANPDTVTGEMLDTYLASGVNRISLGVQSMVPHVLAGLGRTHDPDNVTSAAAEVASRPFRSWNLDLIYGGAGETDGDWVRTVEAVLELGVPHVSAYALTVEAGTPLAEDSSRHPDDDRQAERYVVADEMFRAAGLDWYEISNWARPGHQCRHNHLYWDQGDYIGFGCAAHSHRSGRRWWNRRTPERYLEAVESGSSAEAAGEELSMEERTLEGLQLALRTRRGVPVAAVDPRDLEGPLQGLLDETADGRLVLTTRGRLLANEVAVRLVVPTPV